MIEEGLRPLDIIEVTGLTAHAVYQRIKRMRNSGIDIPPFDGSQRRSIFKYCETVERDPRRASAAHLADLERAGHARGCAELRISSERPARMFTPALLFSATGSQAAMCADA